MRGCDAVCCFNWAVCRSVCCSVLNGEAGCYSVFNRVARSYFMFVYAWMCVCVQCACVRACILCNMCGCGGCACTVCRVRVCAWAYINALDRLFAHTYKHTHTHTCILEMSAPTQTHAHAYTHNTNSHTRNRVRVSHTHQLDDICIRTHKCEVHVSIYHQHPEHADLTLSLLVYLHFITHCNTLPNAALHCNTLQHTAAHCNTLQHTATHCNTLQHTTPGISPFEKGTYQKRGHDI